MFEPFTGWDPEQQRVLNFDGWRTDGSYSEIDAARYQDLLADHDRSVRVRLEELGGLGGAFGNLCIARIAAGAECGFAD